MSGSLTDFFASNPDALMQLLSVGGGLVDTGFVPYGGAPPGAAPAPLDFNGLAFTADTGGGAGTPAVDSAPLPDLPATSPATGTPAPSATTPSATTPADAAAAAAAKAKDEKLAAVLQKGLAGGAGIIGAGAAAKKAPDAMQLPGTAGVAVPGGSAALIQLVQMLRQRRAATGGGSALTGLLGR